jgi:hypothetical protein
MLTVFDVMLMALPLWLAASHLDAYAIDTVLLVNAIGIV